MKKTILPILIAALIASVASTQAQVLIRITEAMSSSGTGGTPDWIELSNLGNTVADITGWKVDDSSRTFGSSLLLNGITSIAAGESVVFFETPTANLTGAWSTDLANFRSFWGGLSGVQVGYYGGSGIGLSSTGDGAVVFNSTGTEQTTYVSFAAATTGTSFNFVYDAAGVQTSAANALSVAGLYGATTVSAAWGGLGTAVSNTAGPGTITTVPEPSSSALLGLGTIALLGLRRLNRKA
jgi:hypothetical protein